MAEHFSIRTPALSLGKPRDVDEKENWPELAALTSQFGGAAGNRTRRSTRQYAF
jgi:hypothetical protein